MTRKDDQTKKGDKETCRLQTDRWQKDSAAEWRMLRRSGWRASTLNHGWSAWQKATGGQ